MSTTTAICHLADKAGHDQSNKSLQDFQAATKAVAVYVLKQCRSDNHLRLGNKITAYRQAGSWDKDSQVRRAGACCIGSLSPEQPDELLQ